MILCGWKQTVQDWACLTWQKEPLSSSCFMLSCISDVDTHVDIRYNVCICLHVYQLSESFNIASISFMQPQEPKMSLRRMTNEYDMSSKTMRLYSTHKPHCSFELHCLQWQSCIKVKSCPRIKDCCGGWTLFLLSCDYSKLPSYEVQRNHTQKISPIRSSIATCTYIAFSI